MPKMLSEVLGEEGMMVLSDLIDDFHTTETVPPELRRIWQGFPEETKRIVKPTLGPALASLLFAASITCIEVPPSTVEDEPAPSSWTL